jgi:RNA polymerase sigma factor (sigma-70 family)
LELTSHTPSPEEILTQEEAFQHMRALIATLSPRRQEIITLKFFGGLRNGEIADILELDERTVASHLSRGLRDLQYKYVAQTQSQALMEVAV